MDKAERIKDLLDRALDLAPESRRGFLDEECGGDPELRAELEELVRASEDAGDFLGGAGAGPLPAAGTRIGRYLLSERIGEGGFGVVYRAEQEEPVRREVALKLVRLGMDSRAVVARFEAERQALARMSHPNVAQVLDGGMTSGGRPFFVMELVDGAPLTEYADRAGLSPRARLALFVQVARGVHHAHQKGLIHRDLKPSNVLVSERDGQPLPKIIDFGVAKATHEPLTQETLTAAREFVGTPEYMAPEQATAGADLDTRADIYSLGVLLYELLTGTKPFEYAALSGGLPELLRHIVEVDPPRPSSRVLVRGPASSPRGGRPAALARVLRGDLDWVVMRALAKDREERYSSAEALAEDIERHLRNEPVHAGPPSTAYRLSKFVRRNRVGVVATAAVVLAVAAGFVATLQEKRRADVHAAEASRERNHVLRLSAFQRLDDLRAAARELWPATAAMIPRYEEWLADADALVAGLDPNPEDDDLGHHAMLAELRSRASRVLTDEDGGAPTWRFVDDQDRWWHAQLTRLVAELEAFADPTTGGIDGLGPPLGWGVRRRLSFARGLAQRTLEGPEARARWAQARASIAEAADSPYGGLVLPPQLGLLPLGRDPESGLWEFWHVGSGAEPTRGADGALVPRPEDGIVLVLLPGGTFHIGAQAKDPDGPNFDPRAQREESPVREVTLAPFFLAKYELTQGQWQRFTGTNPSVYKAGVEYAGKLATLANPVENVSWEEVEEFLRHMGLGLPTEAQWEYGARAESDTPWWVGPEAAWLDGVANLRDAYVELNGVSWQPVDDWMNDGHVVHAPVGSFAPNPFGLFDVHGNVWEWCADGMRNYVEGDFAPGDGLHRAPEAEMKVYRGGSFYQQAVDLRSSFREGFPPATRHNNVGVRAARAVEGLNASGGPTSRR